MQGWLNSHCKKDQIMMHYVGISLKTIFFLLGGIFTMARHTGSFSKSSHRKGAYCITWWISWAPGGGYSCCALFFRLLNPGMVCIMLRIRAASHRHLASTVKMLVGVRRLEKWQRNCNYRNY